MQRNQVYYDVSEFVAYDAMGNATMKRVGQVSSFGEAVVLVKTKSLKRFTITCVLCIESTMEPFKPIPGLIKAGDTSPITRSDH